MKILISTDTYFPMINGVVISTDNLYRELKNKGHDVKIITLSSTGKEKIEGDVYFLKSINSGIYPGTRIKIPFCNRLVKEIIEWKPDIVHSQTEFSTMLVAKYIVNKLGIPHIHTYHTMYEDYVRYICGGKIINRNTVIKITKLLLNTMDCVIAPTVKTERALRNYGVYSDIYVVPTGIDLNKFHQDIYLKEREEICLSLGIKKEDRVLVYVGRAAEEKNIDEIIEDFQELLKKLLRIKLLIVGGGPYLNKLKDIVKVKGLEKDVIFTGAVPQKEVHKYYRLGDIFVTASTSETQGLTYVEALSSECIVVCKYDECIDEVIIHGKNGFIYREKKEFVHYINKILSDEALKRKMKEAAVAKAEEYSSNSFSESILNVYIDKLKVKEIQIAVGY